MSIKLLRWRLLPRGIKNIVSILFLSVSSSVLYLFYRMVWLRFVVKRWRGMHLFFGIFFLKKSHTKNGGTDASIKFFFAIYIKLLTYFMKHLCIQKSKLHIYLEHLLYFSTEKMRYFSLFLTKEKEKEGSKPSVSCNVNKKWNILKGKREREGRRGKKKECNPKRDK